MPTLSSLIGSPQVYPDWEGAVTRLVRAGYVGSIPALAGFCCAFDMMSGNLKCMTVQDGCPRPAPVAAPAPHGGRRADRMPAKASLQGNGRPARRAPPHASHGPHPAHALPSAPHDAREVGRARHARHAPDIGKAMSGGEKRWYALLLLVGCPTCPTCPT